MIRVYFDWNVYTNLKRKSEEPFKSIVKIVDKNSEKLLFPYSPAHLNDLKRGFLENFNAKDKTYIDLELLHEVSQDHCLSADSKNDVIPQIINPKEYFTQLIEDRTLEYFDFDTIISDADETLSPLWKGYLELMKLMPSGIELQKIEEVSEKYDGLKDLFPNLQNGNNFYNLMKDALRLMTNLNEHSSVYKSIRNRSITEMKINTDPQQWGNAFDYLDKILKKARFNKTFKEFIGDNLKNLSQDKSVTRFDYFINYYISLDTFGYYRDGQIANLIDDASHAFYAAHCDIFVTDDNNTYHKAKAVYENFNISTVVCKASNFPSTFYSFKGLGDHSSPTILGSVCEIIRHSFILMKSVDDECNPVIIYKIPHPIVDFFNRMQVSFYNDYTLVFIYKKQSTYSDFMFWTEIKSVVDKIVSDFGIDDHLKMEFKDELERKEISDNAWQGRIWTINSVTAEVLYDYDGMGLVLRIIMPEQH